MPTPDTIAFSFDAVWQLVALGVWFGLVHALDADHLATLGGLATNDRSTSATSYALRWSLGHAAALAAAACAVLALGFGGMAAIGGAAEWAVAGVLLVLALQSFRGAARVRATRPLGAAATVGGGPAESPPIVRRRSSIRGWWLGLLHGGAGSAAVLALLPLAALDGLGLSALYLACFSGGVAAGALAFAHCLGRLLGAAAGRDARLARAVQGAAGVAAVLAGAWLVQELLAGGLERL